MQSRGVNTRGGGGVHLRAPAPKPIAGRIEPSKSAYLLLPVVRPGTEACTTRAALIIRMSHTHRKRPDPA